MRNDTVLTFGVKFTRHNKIVQPIIRHIITKTLQPHECTNVHFSEYEKKNLHTQLKHNSNNSFSNCVRNNDCLNAFIFTHRLIMLHGLANSFFRPTT